MADSDQDFQQAMKDRFQQLPKVVQDAITSADVEQHLRELADGHKLHVDQWDKLQLEVMLTLLGFQEVKQLAANIANVVGTDAATAEALAADVSRIVFEPIRIELERNLGNPQAKTEEETMSGVEQLRKQVLSDAPAQRPAAAEAPTLSDTAVPLASTPTSAPQPAITPATPPIPAPDTTVERAPTPSSYINTASQDRKIIAGDPYREQV